MSEKWAPIAGYEGIYEVSTLGSVRSLDRITVLKNGVRRRTHGTVIGQHRLPNGYLHVTLWKNNEQENAYPHQLVALAFLGPKPAGCEVLHGPLGSMVNCVDNLRWGTRSENILDNVARGTHNESRKTHCPRGHLLADPNLRASVAKGGSRGCLSCHRAQGYIAGRLDLDLQQVSDSYYKKLVSA
nr:NUMOD4 domain-containing protein [Rhodococcus sp. (in: high G+C Gram-positive bacteria)]